MALVLHSQMLSLPVYVNAFFVTCNDLETSCIGFNKARRLDPTHAIQRPQHVNVLIQPRPCSFSLTWHTKHKTGELLRFLDRGNAINRVGELIGFTVIPAFVDMCCARRVCR
jgi:hypothetical protein